MIKGTVKWFSSKKGYGFINDSEGRGEIFVHWTGIINMDGFKHLEEGQTVTFDIVDVERGKQAVNVQIINDEKVEN